MTAQQPEHLERWDEWIRGDLWKEVHEIVQQVHIFQSWTEAVEAADEKSKKPGFLHNWTAHNYLDSIAVGVRRLSDRDDRTRSLRRLLEEVEEGAEQLTREWWMSRAPEDLEDTWAAQFEEISRGNPNVDAGVVREDRKRLVNACEIIKAYVDKHIAHLDADREEIEMPTIGDAHDAISVIYQVFHRWYQVITGAALALVQPPRWEHVLAMPWIDIETAASIADRRREEWNTQMRDVGVLK